MLNEVKMNQKAYPCIVGDSAAEVYERKLCVAMQTYRDVVKSIMELADHAPVSVLSSIASNVSIEQQALNT